MPPCCLSCQCLQLYIKCIYSLKNFAHTLFQNPLFENLNENPSPAARLFIVCTFYAFRPEIPPPMGRIPPHSGERNRCQGNRGIPEQAAGPSVRICRETSLDKRFADHPAAPERCLCAFPCFRRGRVRAAPGRRVKGRVPCGFSGQRPEPSESPAPDCIFSA